MTYTLSRLSQLSDGRMFHDASSQRPRLQPAVVVLAALGMFPLGCSRTPRIADLPPPAAAYLNMSADIRYVGSDTCMECHPDEAESHLQSTHSRALSDVHPDNEPADAEFTHALSGRTYRVYRKDGQLRHQESVRGADGQQSVLADHALRYAVGSGTHARTYLIEDGKFLAESPVTWYRSRDGWAMSPGYEHAGHPGFDRPVNMACLNCHSGGTEAIGGSLFQMRIREQGIGCEQCHGPGELHVRQRQDETQSSSDPDRTIVNPQDLSREQRDAICARCHLGSVTRVRIRGRQPDHFRPGHRFEDFEVAYRVVSKDDPKVAGHVEQMRLSQCYQQSATMTCLTCHNPHEPVPADQRESYYRKRCLQCHATESCGLTTEERLQRDRGDNCVSCHMPRSTSNIPHHALNHHRIGIHKPRNDEKTDPYAIEGGELAPLHDISHLSDLDRDRCLGLACLELASLEPNPALAESYRNRAVRLLEEVRRQGVRDQGVDAALARFYYARGRLEKTIEHARTALDHKPLLPGPRMDALGALADAYYDRQDIGRTMPIYQQLVKQRRVADDWVVLSMCHARKGDRRAALRAAEQAVEIAPHRIELIELLANSYRQNGDHKRANETMQRARRIAESRPQPARPRSGLPRK